MSSENDAQRLTGMVKWFNNKSGFGFITVCSDGEYNGKDIFAHYSSIRVTNSQYKYLVQGEYIDFCVTRSESDKHEFQAMDITGVMNGPIMCETRRTIQSAQLDRTNKRPASPQYDPPAAEAEA
jgi:cold shock CspA family protein